MTDTTEAMRAAFEKLERQLGYVKEDWPYAADTAGGRRLQGAYDALEETKQAALASQKVPEGNLWSRIRSKLNDVSHKACDPNSCFEELSAWLDQYARDICDMLTAAAADREGA